MNDLDFFYELEAQRWKALEQDVTFYKERSEKLEKELAELRKKQEELLESMFSYIMKCDYESLGAQIEAKYYKLQQTIDNV